MAAFITRGERSQGVTELIDELIADDLSRLEGKLTQHFIALGLRSDGSEVTVPPYGVNVLIAGPSGSGKSTITAVIVERLIAQAYQVCIIDPEGDYGASQGVITLGDRRHAVGVNEVLAIVEEAKTAHLLELSSTQRLSRRQIASLEQRLTSSPQVAQRKGFRTNLDTIRQFWGAPLKFFLWMLGLSLLAVGILTLGTFFSRASTSDSPDQEEF
jgi:hypothetical protein